MDRNEKISGENGRYSKNFAAYSLRRLDVEVIDLYQPGRIDPTVPIEDDGLGASYEDVSGVYDTVVIGPFTFRHVWGPAGSVPIVGMEMLRRFTMTFDVRRGLLYLEPNASLSEPLPAPS